jgi:4-hydroxythreonine-4-phosphate dehydrogenase
MERKQGKDDRPLIGISHGDINGINYEIILKAFEDNRMMEMFNCILYGSLKAINHYQNTLDLPKVSFNKTNRTDRTHLKKYNIIPVHDKDINIETGKSTAAAGQLAYQALEKAVSDLGRGYIDALVTAPIDKHNIQSEEFKYAGHTDYLADVFETKNYLMLLVANSLRIGVVTGHIPINKVSESLNSELILSKIKVMQQSLLYDFGIRNPKIAVLGLNPHASDGGVIGNEEEKIIIPAIEKAKKEGILAFGPYPADGFFASSNYTAFDGILAMYHDQGLIPFKTLSFEDGVNFTAGLPVVRTSPAHGTAYDIAGKNQASENSLRQAIYLAADIIQNRKEHNYYSKNPLKTKHQLDQTKDEDISNLTDESTEATEGLSI